MYNLIQKLFETFCHITSLGEGSKYYFGSFRFQNSFERMTSQPITNSKVEKFNTEIPNSDKPLISPNSITPESNIRIMRKKGNTKKLKKLLIVRQILLVSIPENVWRTVCRTWILMLRCKGLK